MTREQYLTELAVYLKRLPKADFEDSMAYFKELFDEAGPEGESDLMASLGSPREAASEATGQILEEKIETASSSKDKISLVWFAFLALLAAPTGLILLLPVLTILFTGVVLVFSFLVVLYSIALTFTVLSGAFLWESLVHFQTWGMLFFNIGGFLLSFGLGVLLILGSVRLTQGLGQLVVRLAKIIYGKVRKHG